MYFSRHMLMDLVIAMVPYLDKESIKSLYKTILPWLQVGNIFIFQYFLTLLTGAWKDLDFIQRKKLPPDATCFINLQREFDKN